MIISEKNASQIAKELKKVTGRDINVIAPDGKIIASTDKNRIGKIHEGAKKLVSEGLDKLTVYDTDCIGGAREGINLPVIMDGETVGVIGITGKPEEVSPLGTVIKKMTEIMLQNHRQQEREAAMENARNVFAERWLYASDEEAENMPSGDCVLGIELSQPRVIAVLECMNSHSGEELRLAETNRYIRRELEKTTDFLNLQIHGRTVLILHSEDPDKTAEMIKCLIDGVYRFSGMSMRCGISAVSYSEKQIRQCYQQAKTACSVAMKMKSKRIVLYNEPSPEMILQSISQEVREGLRQQIFSRCTQENKKIFIETLKLYFENDGCIEKIAELAYVHRNTIYYRIEQIKKLTGLDLKKPRDSFMLYVASSEYETI